MAQQAEKRRTIRRIILITIVLLFLFLAGFQVVPLTYGSSEQYISQASLQLARSNGLAKNALLLQHGASTQQTQALSDMQVSLPLFVGEQNTLLKSSQQDIQTVLQEAQSNYLAIVAATTSIIHRQSVPADPTQVTIVVNSSRGYNTTMSQYLIVLQNVANAFNQHLVLLQEVITILLVLCVTTLLYKPREKKQP